MDQPNWVRLQKALSVEADGGFHDLVGREYRFSEFLALNLDSPPKHLSERDRQQWLQLATQYGAYPNLTAAQRQHLVAETRRFLYQTRKNCEILQQADLNQERVSSAPPQPTGGPDQSKQNQVGNSQPVKRVRVADPSRSINGSVALTQSLTYLPGMGPKNAERLAKLGLYTVQDVLFYYPRDYLDYARQVDIRYLEAGQTVTVVGTVRRCQCFTSPRNSKLTILELVIHDRTGQLKLNRFLAGNRYANRGWQEQQKRLYQPGTPIAASGLVKESKYGITLDNPELEVLDTPKSPLQSDIVGQILPIYPLTEGVSADLVRRAVKATLPAVVQLQDPLPIQLCQQYNLVDLASAIVNIHDPRDRDQLDAARRRLVFDEFFYLQLGLLQRRQAQQQRQSSAILAATGALIDTFYGNLPFQLTNAQQRVVNEILLDLQRSTPMNRLVQGDVGSGKTVVAVIALLAAIQASYQGALMAPTEVLAEQHYRKLVGWFNVLHLPVELLTGSTKQSKRKQIFQQLETGELPLLVGTHALIEDGVIFQRLGLVVIDEQHRFGVHQRARLQQKGIDPHVLTMTATPIPRTLALTLHGDLDVSQIDELPPGRKAIQTTVLKSRDRLQAYELIRREVVQGRQTYIVLPLVDESEKLDLRSAIAEHQHLQETIFPDFQVGLLHGRMSSADKEAAIAAFRLNETQILVSTTVVEVGVDVPNATVMLIEHAERFGLSQLHQLRGRVGRGAAQSFCLLMNSSKTESAQQRLKVLEQSQDGFFIAEMDLRFRGPGEILGSRQSGLPDLALASLVEDQAVLEVARDAAERVMAKDPTLERWPSLKTELSDRYRRLMGGTIFT
jgi:ATP-dependent DNA helicase RecG